LAHDFRNQAIDRSNPGFLFAAGEHFGPMHIPGSPIGPWAFAEIFMFDSGGAARRWSQGRLLAATQRSQPVQNSSIIAGSHLKDILFHEFLSTVPSMKYRLAYPLHRERQQSKEK